MVGGGISGLAAAWELRSRADVTVFEPGHIGGRIRTELFEGRPVDCAADAFLTRSPDATALCAELGIDDLVAPAAGRAMLWWRDRLELLPEGTVLGAPTRLRPLIDSNLISTAGWLRAAADLILPARRPAGDVSAHRLVAGRFGAQVADRLADPLISSIHAGRSQELSAAATVPQLYNAAAGSRSLMRALSRTGPTVSRSAAPVFLAPRSGMQTLTDVLAARLREGGVTFEAAEVKSVVPCEGGAELGGERYDGCVLAVGAATAHRLLGAAAPGELAAIPTASVALVTLGYPELELPAGISGLLASPDDRPDRVMTACSFASQKWPHWANPGRSVVRLSAGRYGDRRIEGIDDAGLVERLAAELARATGQPAAQPDTWRVSRWSDSFPQYLVGHLARVGAIDDHLRRDAPGIAVCGSSYRGVGVPACIASGQAAARRLYREEP